jgi:hypothetical protein
MEGLKSSHLVCTPLFGVELHRLIKGNVSVRVSPDLAEEACILATSDHQGVSGRLFCFV